MKTIFRSAALRQACALALAASCTLPAGATEPGLLTADLLTADLLSANLLTAGAISVLPAAEAVAQVGQVPPAAEAPPSKQEDVTWAIAGEALRAVDLEELDHERGRADTVLNDTRINGDVANNSAVNVNTGSNTIDAGSFANMSGIPVVIQNSGANVLIQNATVVNLQFQ